LSSHSTIIDTIRHGAGIRLKLNHGSTTIELFVFSEILCRVEIGSQSKAAIVRDFGALE
jgi:hypothetical protein